MPSGLDYFYHMGTRGIKFAFNFDAVARILTGWFFLTVPPLEILIPSRSASSGTLDFLMPFTM